MYKTKENGALELPCFMEISSTILQENALNMSFDSGANFSFPVLGQRGGRLVDGMFLFSEATGGRPFAWILLESETGVPLLYARCGVSDFVDTACYPLDKAVELSLPAKLTEKAYAQRYQQLYEVYEELRRFPFEPAPGEEQRKIMRRYRELFLSLACTGHYPFYKALSREFFGWLDMLADVEPEVSVSDEPPREAGIQPEAVAALLENIQQGLDGLARQFTERIATDSHKEGLFDDMHAELMEYKKGLISALTEPLERDIIKIIDDIGKTIEAYRGRPPSRENYNRFFSIFEGTQTDLSDLLYRQGIEPYRVEGTKVEILRQQILATVPTDDPKLDKTLAHRHSTGWEKTGKIIRPERISVYLYTPEEKE